MSDNERVYLSEVIRWIEKMEAHMPRSDVARVMSVHRNAISNLLKNKSWRRDAKIRTTWLKYREEFLRLTPKQAQAIADAIQAEERASVANAKPRTKPTACETEPGDTGSVRESSAESTGTFDEVAISTGETSEHDAPGLDGDAHTSEVVGNVQGSLASNESEDPDRNEREADKGCDVKAGTPAPVPADSRASQPTRETQNALTETPVEDLLAVVDYHNGRRHGHRHMRDNLRNGDADPGLSIVYRQARDYLIERIRTATTHAEIALYAGAPVLAEVPYLSLENAKRAGRARLEGWHPAKLGEAPAGLHGDALILLVDGRPARYADEGAKAVAFAPNDAWEDLTDHSALQMRYSVTIEQRQQRYACESHTERPSLIGYRASDQVPERPFRDSDWHFGSLGFRDKNGTWKPSTAHLLAWWYRIREVRDAFAGTDAERLGSPFWNQIERMRLSLECELLGDEYAMTLPHYGGNLVLGRPTRVRERRWMGRRLIQLDKLIARGLRRNLWRRIRRRQFADVFTEIEARKRKRQWVLERRLSQQETRSVTRKYNTETILCTGETIVCDESSGLPRAAGTTLAPVMTAVSSTPENPRVYPRRRHKEAQAEGEAGLPPRRYRWMPFRWIWRNYREPRTYTGRADWAADPLVAREPEGLLRWYPADSELMTTEGMSETVLIPALSTATHGRSGLASRLWRVIFSEKVTTDA